MKFSGELHKVKLINFSIEKEELNGMLPEKLKVLDYKGRALISMVDVQLKKMSASSFLPSFAYRHVAFRLVIDDSEYSKEGPKGIYFLKSFSSNAAMVLGGNLVANYNLCLSKFQAENNGLKISLDNQNIQYRFDESKVSENEELFQAIKRIDRAYAFKNDKVEITRITRKEWPIEPLNIVDFKTNFFKSAKLEGAFEVKKVIDYIWEKPVQI
jgi:uncharacterized protein YqjF (DUF2071 family)